MTDYEKIIKAKLLTILASKRSNKFLSMCHKDHT